MPLIQNLARNNALQKDAITELQNMVVAIKYNFSLISDQMKAENDALKKQVALLKKELGNRK